MNAANIGGIGTCGIGCFEDIPTPEQLEAARPRRQQADSPAAPVAPGRADKQERSDR